MIFYYLNFVFCAAYCYNIRNNDIYTDFHLTSLNSCVTSSDDVKFSPMFKLSLQECVSHCAVTENCAGLTYNRKNLFCQLFSELNVKENKGDSVFIKRSDILATPQGMHLCENDEACITRGCLYPEVANGKPIGNIFHVDSIQIIQCDSGYFIVGTDMIQCMSNSSWSTLPECYKECEPPVIDNANVDGDMTQFPARATVMCHDNYVSTSTTNKSYNVTKENLICDKAGRWIPDITCTSYLNIFSKAFNKPARQSSTYRRYSATLATDGLWYPSFADMSCAHTAFTEETSWWEVDLLDIFIIRRLIILNRLNAYFSKRLHDVTITIGKEPNPTEICAFYPGDVPPAVMIELFCGHVIEGRYVRFSKPNNLYNQDNLALCEVGIYDD